MHNGHEHDGHHHSHDHEHAHTHDHTHEHAHTHSHEHVHTHSHDHAHDTAHQSVSGGDKEMEKTIAIMTYMLEHNRHHAEELSQLTDKLEAAGKQNAAALLREGVKSFDAGNNNLDKALKEIMEG